VPYACGRHAVFQADCGLSPPQSERSSTLLAALFAGRLACLRINKMDHSAGKAGIAGTLGLVIVRGQALHAEACVRVPIDV
jgi:hypothetical protein